MDESIKIRALVAEDEESFLRVLTTVLEATQRFEVYPCESGDEALETLKRSQFDVIILDHKMPGLTGLNVLQWLHEQKSEIPVVMLTGAGSENIAVEAMKLGAYDYLRKDQFDKNHFPILVYGVYERYLFRKEKEQLHQTALDREKNLAALNLIMNSVTTLSEIVKMAIARLAFLTDESEHLLRTYVHAGGKERLDQYFRQLREELETLAYASKSMVGVPSVQDEPAARNRDVSSSTAPTPRQEETIPKKQLHPR
jgi:DNA-binding response OmpR family regulator